jgi:hypothetical protein
VYPGVALLENMPSRFNPLTLLRSGLKAFTYMWNGDGELLDDLVLISYPPRLRLDLMFFERMSIGRPNPTWYLPLHCAVIFSSWDPF